VCATTVTTAIPVVNAKARTKANAICFIVVSPFFFHLTPC
jgi:hypothetical protein